MIGIFFFGSIALWALIALVLGVKLPEWLRIQRYRLPWTVVCVVLVFFAPVADEIIAWPQLQGLCKDAGRYLFLNGQTEKSVSGRTVKSNSFFKTILLSESVRVQMSEDIMTDATTKEDILRSYMIEPKSSFAAFPDGSGGRVTWLLKSCGYTGSEQGLANKKYIADILKLTIN